MRHAHAQGNGSKGGVRLRAVIWAFAALLVAGAVYELANLQRTSPDPEPITYKQVKLYFYNPDKDRDETGNVMCSRDGLEAVDRQIPVTMTPIQDTVRLLLAGGLKPEEVARGITTEYPLEGVELVGASLNDGLLVLELRDDMAKTSGGACRAGILWFQIEATARQFPEVEQVRFKPEELFQP